MLDYCGRMGTNCIDADIWEPHPAHAHVKPTGEGPGIAAIVWCEGYDPDKSEDAAVATSG